MTNQDSQLSPELIEKSRTSFERLKPRLERRLGGSMDEAVWLAFITRVEENFERLFSPLFKLYGHHYDFFFHLESLLITLTEMWISRPDDLKALDAARTVTPNWFQPNTMVGASCYVDCFGGTLSAIQERIPYLKELGLSYLHLMPLFKTPSGDNDGGYAISSYREVNPELGTVEELQELGTILRNHGISLCLDFVFNHTADNHVWAKEALDGSSYYQNYYRMYPDRTEPDEFERTTPEIFPEEHTGCFTYRSKIRRWVWTTFHNYQWDLNYENPAVFNSMAGEMLFLANLGIEVLRLDAVAFLWKKKGTSCQNLPEAHLVIQAFNAVANMVAPALLFKSEAIVHPDEVTKYIKPEECQLSYNPQLMALLWEALATQNATLLSRAMSRSFNLDDRCSWVNYIRCHDDVGWVFSDSDVQHLGMDPKAHRSFLSDFYTGKFPTSFARGLPFQDNPETGDSRVSGTTASLAGLERAIELEDEEGVALAIRRIHLLHGILMTIGGIPLIYLGDELGFLNDYSFEDDPEKLGDSRWVHRPWFDWEKTKHRMDASIVEGRIFQGLLGLIQVRQRTPAFSGATTEFIDTGNQHVFGYFRNSDQQTILVLANFSGAEQVIRAKHLRLLGIRKSVTDLVSGRLIVASERLVLEPYQFMVVSSGP